MSDLSTTFNWHEERAKRKFYDWLLPTVMVGLDEEKWETIKEASTPEGGKPHEAVKLQILLNGVEVNAEHFIEGVERNMNWYADKMAKEILSEMTSFDAIYDAMQEVRRTILSQLKAAGVEVHEDDYYG